MQIDIMTGSPKGAIEADKHRRHEEKQLEGQATTGLAIEVQLTTEQGTFFTQLVFERLEKRISELVEADPQAKTLKDILENLSYKINLGRSAAEKLTRMRMEKK